MKIQLKSKVVLLAGIFLFLTYIALLYFSNKNVNQASIDNPSISVFKASFGIDYNRLEEVVGDADYVFVGNVVSEDDVVYKHAVTVETEDGKTQEVSTPYTNYTVNITQNIKGNLITEEDIPIQKAGGFSKDGTECFLYEGDELPIAGNTYIFFAYAQLDGSLLVSGPISNINIKAESADRSIDGQTSEYDKVVDAYNRQIDTGRDRSVSVYEAE